MIHDTGLNRRLNALSGMITRRGTLRAIFQSLWLGVLVFTGGLLLTLFRDWPLDLRLYALAGGGFALLYIVVDLLLNRVDIHRLARRLDQRLGLREQTTTALDIATQDAPRTYLEGLLLQRAGDTLATAEGQVRRVRWLPLREIETLMATILLAIGLYVLIGMGGSLPSASPRPLPPLPNPAAKQSVPRPQPNAQGQQPVMVPGGEMSDGMRRALEALAGALGDQATTAGAAEALRQGDTAGAGEALRRLADQVNGLSQGARRDLSQALRQGAQATQNDAPNLAEQLRRSAAGVERGGTQAQRALEDLARELERMGQQGGQQAQGQGQQGQQQGQGQGQGAPGQPGQAQSPGQGQGQGQGQGEQGAGQGQGQGAGQGAGQQREGTDDRNGVEGMPVELAAQPNPNEPTTRRADPNAQPKGQASGAQFGQGGAPTGGAVEAGADPLRYPWEYRGVVQEYFTPSR